MGLTPRAADSTDPAAIPDVFTLRPNGVIAYADGRWAWTPEQLARFPRFESISVTGAPGAMRVARWVDVERFDATSAEVPACWDARRAYGFADFGVYCDRSTVGEVLDATDGAEPLWWIATLDSQPWTPLSLAADIWNSYRVMILPHRIRWIQNQPMGSYDVSRGFGPETWTLNRASTRQETPDDP
jgi:hypothetical protein